MLAEYNMNRERYTIGRLPDNDIRIDNPAVSGHHSLIINILNDSFLEDLNSTNGTYVNGKLIKKHALQHGDVITAGHHQLRFVEDDEAQQDEFEKTMVIQPSARPVDKLRVAVQRMVPPPLPSVAARSPTAQRRPSKAKLQVLSGAFAGRELELSKALTTLGRPGVQVAAITRRSEGYFIVHVDAEGDNNFPLVNGAADRRAGPQARRQRRDPARRRKDGVLRGLGASAVRAHLTIPGEQFLHLPPDLGALGDALLQCQQQVVAQHLADQHWAPVSRYHRQAFAAIGDKHVQRVAQQHFRREHRRRIVHDMDGGPDPAGRFPLAPGASDR